MATELPKNYEPATAEAEIYALWLKSDDFKAIPDDRAKRYVIMMPLPNVTGALHMGHAMDNVMQDMLTRWHRMMGDNALWMPGTDHAGIATQAVVEKRLFELEGKTRHDVGREGLVKRIWEWKETCQNRIVKQLQSMGASCDWSRMRFTMDKVCTRAVRDAFFRLFDDGLIFRGDRLVNWDCQLMTAVADDEIVHETVKGHFYHLKYPIVDPKPGEPDHVVVATTRPETMLGDTAVACHPDPAAELDRLEAKLTASLEKAPAREKAGLEADLARVRERRTTHLPTLVALARMAREGRKVRLPLLDREIPLIVDGWAKPDLGSGCVKITPAHDPNDYDVWKRHKEEIAILNILETNGKLNANAGPYKGHDRFDARKKVVADLQAQGLLPQMEEREIEIGHSDRSKTPIEPFLSKQWFVKMSDVEGGIVLGRGTKNEFTAPGLAQVAMDAVRGDWKSPTGRKLTFHPDPVRYGDTYYNWLAEKRDWCISRQLWWGHRIPIWHASFPGDQVAAVLAGLPAEKGRLSVWVLTPDGALKRPGDLGHTDAASLYEIQVGLRDEEIQGRHEPALEKLGFKQDPDVLDTWFSSALWPHSTLGWPDPETAEVDEGQTPTASAPGRPDTLSYYYPGSCLVTGRDIITLWVARMALAGLYNLGDLPFTDSFIHANILDGKGERMSKSKGNGIDPVDIIERYGTDAMRYILCDMQTGIQDIRLPVQAVSPYTQELVDLTSAKHGRTIFTYICPGSGKEFDVLGTMPDLPSAKIISDRFEVGRNFCTKLWNATRFAFMNLGDFSYQPLKPADLADEDRWILSRLARASRQANEGLEAYNPSAALGAVRDFFWTELCDWYLEIIKPRIRDEAKAAVPRTVLSYVLDQVLRLLHPFVPFITETLWQKLNEQVPVRGLFAPLPASPRLIRAPWPAADASHENPALEEAFKKVQEMVGTLREMRASYNINPGKELEAKAKATASASGVLEPYIHHVVNLARLSSFAITPTLERPPLSAARVLGEMEIFLLGAVDPEKERVRLEKQKEKLAKQIEASEKKLSNPSFRDRAPAEVVETEKQRIQEAKAELELLDQNLAALGS